MRWTAYWAGTQVRGQVHTVQNQSRRHVCTAATGSLACIARGVQQTVISLGSLMLTYIGVVACTFGTFWQSRKVMYVVPLACV